MLGPAVFLEESYREQSPGNKEHKAVGHAIYCLQFNFLPPAIATSIYFALDQVILSGTPFEEVKQPVGLPLWQRERKEEKKERIKKGKRKRERNRKKK